MRLIDADALMKKFCVNSEGRRIPEVDCDNHEITVSIKDIKRIIREQPTAYDVDKAVEELNSAENYYYDDEIDEEGDLIMVKSVRQDVAINIVRKGGVT